MNIPTTLEEAISELGMLLGKEDLAFLDACATLECVSVLQPTVGRLLRTQWDLWNPDSKLAKHLRLQHNQNSPDDMSRFVLNAFYQSRLPTRFEKILCPESSCPISRPIQ